MEGGLPFIFLELDSNMNIKVEPKLPALKWIVLKDWSNSYFPVAGKSGLLRFSYGSKIVYIGMETRSLGQFRRFATRGGSARRHWGGRKTYARRRWLTLEYAFYDKPPSEIRRVRDALCAKHRPRFNVPPGKRKRRPQRKA
jgi:hypothetical protein